MDFDITIIRWTTYDLRIAASSEIEAEKLARAVMPILIPTTDDTEISLLPSVKEIK